MYVDDVRWAETGRSIDDPFNIHYHVVGEGPPLVLIQAFGISPGGSAWMLYAGVIDELAKRYRCILVDLPNYGWTGPVTYHEPVHDLYARTVVAVMESEGVSSAPIVGHSIGGTTAIVMALDHPTFVERLVVGSCHASTGGDPYLLGPFPSEVGKLTREAAAAPGDADKLRRLLGALWYDAELVTDELVSELLQFKAEHSDHLAADRGSNTVRKSHMAELAELRIPMMVVHGRFDRMVPLEQALQIIGYVPQADLMVLNRCGHWPPFERSAEYLDAIVPFLSRP